MVDYNEWFFNNEDDLHEKFIFLNRSVIQSDWNIKFRDSYPDFEQFLNEEEDYIIHNLLGDEWNKFVNDEHVSAVSSEADIVYDRLKDEQAELSFNKN